MTRPTALSSPEFLVVEVKKMKEYLLNLDHKVGGSKAKFFLSRGFDLTDLELFASALRNHGAIREVIKVEPTQFGTKYVVLCAIETPDGKNPCIGSYWIVEGNGPARLISAYPGG